MSAWAAACGRPALRPLRGRAGQACAAPRERPAGVRPPRWPLCLEATMPRPRAPPGAGALTAARVASARATRPNLSAGVTRRLQRLPPRCCGRGSGCPAGEAAEARSVLRAGVPGHLAAAGLGRGRWTQRRCLSSTGSILRRGGCCYSFYSCCQRASGQLARLVVLRLRRLWPGGPAVVRRPRWRQAAETSQRIPRAHRPGAGQAPPRGGARRRLQGQHLRVLRREDVPAREARRAADRRARRGRADEEHLGGGFGVVFGEVQRRAVGGT
mmetsp:Transcript_22362/g.58344  ORF Transcript_22362/g.58344 Transcript_22362/m.58344 type:complete len:270 (-) Transcript_22362:29-838(-)